MYKAGERPCEVGRLKRLGAMGALSLLLSSCSILPSQGPSTADVMKEQNYAEQDATPRFVIAELDARTIGILGGSRRPTLAGSFGSQGTPSSTAIGVGDAVSVTVWEAASGGLFSASALNGVSTGSRSAAIPEQVVGRDGSITVPYAGRVHVVGLTPDQVERAIVSRLMGKAIEPQALVTVPKNVSNSVTVNGDVTSGARVPLTARGDKILDVIASAGGSHAPVYETFIALSRGRTTVKVPMQALLTNPQENIFVRGGDVLTVMREPQTFTVFGASGRNSQVPFEASGITLEEALAKSGGLNDNLADATGVFLLRIEPASLARQLDPNFPIQPGQRMVNVVYHVNLKDTESYFRARRFRIENKDMIYIATAPITEFYKVMQLFTTAAQPALIAAGAVRR